MPQSTEIGLMSSPTLELAQALIARPSVTPDDAGCQELVAARLAACGFRIESMPFGAVRNLWARYGTEAPLVCLAGHTDVVPPGPRERWSSEPFTPEVRAGVLYGRGAADMKGAVAALVVAAAEFVAAVPRPRGSLALLLTSDEEGVAIDGTVRVIERLSARGERIDYCLLGEPSSDQRLGDRIKNGRRGSLNARLWVLGKQGHVAYPRLAANPIHCFAPTLARLCAEEWDRGNAHFPPTSLQVSHLAAGTGAENVIPGELDVRFNLRFSTEWEVTALQQRVAALLDESGCDYQLDWHLSGLPFLTPPGRLVGAATEAVRQVLGYAPQLSTDGGTSDGRFIAPTGAEVIELGPLNATIHQTDECVAVADLDALTRIYRGILERLLR